MEKLKKQIEEVVEIYKSRDLTKAEKMTKELVSSNSKVVFLYNLLGLILVDQKKIDEAEDFYNKGLKVDPNFAMIYNNLGLLYANHRIKKRETDDFSNFEKAKFFYKKCITLNKNIPEAYNNLGTLYNSQNKIDKAIDSYKKAISINPNFPFSYHNLGNAYISLGKMEDARKNLLKAIKLSPNLIIAHRTLSRLIKYTQEDEHFNNLKKLYKDTKNNNSEIRMELAFALGKAYEDMKNFEKSFSFYQEANLINRKKISFSIKNEKSKFDEVKNIYNAKLFEEFKNEGHNTEGPIFIVGMPRSGTTLIEQILSSHSSVFGADEIELLPRILKKYFGDNDLRLFFNKVVDFKNENFEIMGKEYEKKMMKISNNSKRYTDKLLTNFLLIGFIKLILPKSKIINCQRDPRDNCFSIYKTHFTSGKVHFAYDLNEIVEYYKLYSDLMKYWINLFPNFIYNLSYETLIENSTNEIKKILKFCNLEWEESCLHFYKNQRPIRTASDVQARSKLYKSSIHQWNNYEKFLNNYFTKLIN